ncbi:hypothetical protein [Patiriisocius marinus]|uniref:hypothetical protein n=1 Tax=Patiriisocius marinus TaxID=1397112 RepID=UPI00232BBDE9|nr:hypothetical protein [Patiriisocius marinus]
MNKKKKFKYLLFSLFIAISFISCGGDNDNDDDVEVIDEQETTDEITGPNLLLCDNIDIQLAVVDNNVTLSWGGMFLH